MILIQPLVILTTRYHSTTKGLFQPQKMNYTVWLNFGWHNKKTYLFLLSSPKVEAMAMKRSTAHCWKIFDVLMKPLPSILSFISPPTSAHVYVEKKLSNLLCWLISTHNWGVTYYECLFNCQKCDQRLNGHKSLELSTVNMNRKYPESGPNWEWR